MDYYINHEAWQVQNYPHDHLSSDLTQEIIKKYRGDCDTFFETGTNEGLGVAQAINAGFEDVHSVEVCESFFLTSFERYKDYRNVNIYLGNANDILRLTLPFLKENKIFFWLDAWNYYSMPVLYDLGEIAKHENKNNVILINNVNKFETKEWNYLPKEEAESEILKINGSYLIEEHGNIMVARIPPV